MLGRRDDGYHLLDSLIAFAAVCDTLAVWPADELSFAVDGPFAASLRDSGNEQDNLVLRAVRALGGGASDAATPGARIVLTKNLPVASGIGGGSSDAAAALKLLNEFWHLGRGGQELAALGMALGADVPVCLSARTAYIGGVGETIDPVPALPPAGLVLVNPGAGISTASVFSRYSAFFSEAARLKYAPYDAESLATALAARRNDLTEAASALVPAIGDVLAAFDAEPGCLLSRLSGSGATCFGLFRDSAAARRAADRLADAHDDWWVQETRFLDRAPLPVPVE